MFCSKCGREIENDANYCPNCGQKVSGTITYQNEDVPQIVYVKNYEKPKSVFIALLLCFFFGMIGLHDFYLRRNSAAITKIVILVILGKTGVGIAINAIWSFFDFFIILFKGYDALKDS